MPVKAVIKSDSLCPVGKAWELAFLQLGCQCARQGQPTLPTAKENLSISQPAAELHSFEPTLDTKHQRAACSQHVLAVIQESPPSGEL